MTGPVGPSGLGDPSPVPHRQTIEWLIGVLRSESYDANLTSILSRALDDVPPDVAPGPAFQAQKAEQRRTLPADVYDTLTMAYQVVDVAAVAQAIAEIQGRYRREPDPDDLSVTMTPSSMVVAPLPDFAAQPVREWGVRHGDDCDKAVPGSVSTWIGRTKEQATLAAESSRAVRACTAAVVSRVPGGVWEPADGEAGLEREPDAATDLTAELERESARISRVLDYADTLSRTSGQRPEVLAVDVAWAIRNAVRGSDVGREES